MYLLNETGGRQRYFGFFERKLENSGLRIDTNK